MSRRNRGRFCWCQDCVKMVARYHDKKHSVSVRKMTRDFWGLCALSRMSWQEWIER